MALTSARESDELLPQRWSDTDQLIFEYLLLAQPGDAPHSVSSSISASPSSPTASELPAAAARTTASAAANVKATSKQQKAVAPKKRKRKRMTADARKFQHREVQRRFMARKKEAAASAKKAVAGLETQFRLLELVGESQALEQENASLRGAFGGPVADVQSLEQLKLHLEEEKKIVERCFQPVSSERWQDLVGHVMEEMDSQATDPSFSSVGFSVLGWSDRRKVDGSAVKFTFSKFFPHVWAEELLNKTWDKVSIESYASFFSPALYVTVHLLQRVNDDAIIVYRAICNPTTGRISRSVELIGRLRRERDFVIFIRSFDGAYDVRRSVGEPASWSRSLTILRFEPTSMAQTTPGCTVHSGGVYGNLVTGGVQHWLMEVLFLVLRFESAMIAPIFKLCSDDTV